MTPSNKGINISILGKDFSVACSPEEQDDLLAAARYLDNSMKEIQKSGKIIGSERTAIMAALNITNDLLLLKKSAGDSEKIEARLNDLQQRVSSALNFD